MSSRVLTFPAGNAPAVDRRNAAHRTARMPTSQLRAIRIAEQVEREVAKRKSLRLQTGGVTTAVSVRDAWKALCLAVGRKLTALFAGNRAC